MFFVGRSWAADDEIIALLARIAENVSFALDNFERANAKARADEQKKRLTRMFAALSATNEAIMRARSRTEMFELVCKAAAQGGRFNSTSILLVQARQRLSRHGRRRRADRGKCPAAEGFDQRDAFRKGAAFAGRRSVRGRPASTTIFSVDPRSGAFNAGDSNRRSEVGCRVSAVGRRAACRRDALHLRRSRHLHGRICRTAATAGR